MFVGVRVLVEVQDTAEEVAKGEVYESVLDGLERADLSVTVRSISTQVVTRCDPEMRWHVVPHKGCTLR